MTSTRPVAALDDRLYIRTHDKRSDGVSRGRASKDHRDLISSKLNDGRKLARPITQYRDIYIYIYFFLPTPSRISLYSLDCVISLANFRLFLTLLFFRTPYTHVIYRALTRSRTKE